MKSIFRKIADIFSSYVSGTENLSVTKKQVITLAGKVEPRVEISVNLLDRLVEDPIGNEAWLLDILDESGLSIVDWNEHNVSSPLEIRQLDNDSKPALLFTDSAEIFINLPFSSELKFLSHPWSSKISITNQQKSVEFDLFSPAATSRSVFIADDVIENQEFQIGKHGRSVIEQSWLDQIREKNPKVISVLNPEWRGVRSASENLVPDSLLIKDNLNEFSARRYANLLVETGCKKIWVGGLPLSYEMLLKEIKLLRDDIEIFVFWLGNFMQSNEEYLWESFQAVTRLHKEGIIKKICFAKKGMAETISKTGAKTGFVESYVAEIPTNPSIPKSGGPHIGIWALAPVWRKTPYAMIAAVSEIENATVSMVGQDARAEELADFLGVKGVYQSEPVPQEDMPKTLSEMHLNLYVTLSECSPMLPLESLAVGVPCLFGPNSHLFEDHPYLHSRLVVPYPDRSDIIAGMIRQALQEREQIIEEYKQYAPLYIENAQKSLDVFLNE